MIKNEQLYEEEKGLYHANWDLFRKEDGIWNFIQFWDFRLIQFSFLNNMDSKTSYYWRPRTLGNRHALHCIWCVFVKETSWYNRFSRALTQPWFTARCVCNFYRYKTRTVQDKDNHGTPTVYEVMEYILAITPCGNRVGLGHLLQYKSLAGMQEKCVNASYLWNLEAKAEVVVYDEWPIITGYWINHRNRRLLGTTPCDDPIAV